MYFKKLEGPRVYLSPMNPDDAPVYTKWINDLGMTHRLGMSTRNYNVDAEREAIVRMSSGGHNYSIILKDDDGVDKLIGNVSLMDIDSLQGTAEIGIFIGEDDKRGKGYGPEAMNLLMAYGFKVLNLNNIMLKVFEFNKYAIKAYEKIGFTEVGRRRKCYFLNGRYYDNVFMDILRDEFSCEYLNEILP